MAWEETLKMYTGATMMEDIANKVGGEPKIESTKQGTLGYSLTFAGGTLTANMNTKGLYTVHLNNKFLKRHDNPRQLKDYILEHLAEWIE